MILLPVWAALSVFVARKRWEVVKVAFAIFQTAVLRPAGGESLTGRLWPVVLEEGVMLGEVAMVGSWIFRVVLIPT